MGRLARGSVLAVMAAAAFSACERDALVGMERPLVTTRDGGNAGASGGGNTGGSQSDTGSACEQTLCQGHLYLCGNCIDDDHDGLVDMDDPDCLGPCHNAEDTFYGSIPGQDHAGCIEDCYFDQDSGSGNDGCLWSHACDPGEVAPAFAPAGDKCAYDPQTVLTRGETCQSALAAQAPTCVAVCGPLTPNGCDCFGCCEIPGADTPVWLGSVDAAGKPSCDLAHVSDPTRCKPCKQVEACLNRCDTCERCVGKVTLPASCTTGSDCPTPLCPGGHPCGAPCLPHCPTGTTCVTGCCVAPPR